MSADHERAVWNAAGQMLAATIYNRRAFATIGPSGPAVYVTGQLRTRTQRMELLVIRLAGLAAEQRALGGAFDHGRALRLALELDNNRDHALVSRAIEFAQAMVGRGWSAVQTFAELLAGGAALDSAELVAPPPSPAR